MGFDPSSDGEDGGDVDGGFRPSSVWILSQTEITTRSDEKVKKERKEKKLIKWDTDTWLENHSNDRSQKSLTKDR